MPHEIAYSTFFSFLGGRKRGKPILSNKSSQKNQVRGRGWWWWHGNPVSFTVFPSVITLN